MRGEDKKHNILEGYIWVFLVLVLFFAVENNYKYKDQNKSFKQLYIIKGLPSY